MIRECRKPFEYRRGSHQSVLLLDAVDGGYADGDHDRADQWLEVIGE
jgi:hypothetical protein